MSRLFALLLLLVLAFAPQVASAQETKKDATAELLSKLRKPIDVSATDELQLQAFADLVSERFGVPVTYSAVAFENQSVSGFKMSKSKGLSLAAVLRQTLAERNATYLVRKGHIEIVSIFTAAKEAKISGADDDGIPRLSQPLVSAIYKEKPINEAFADLAEEYDLTIVLAPQAGDNKAGFVNARLLNVPADKAIEMLALQADLRVVKKGSSYFVTGKDHAHELFNEALEKKKQLLEVEQTRNAPFGFPMGGLAPAPAPAPKP